MQRALEESTLTNANSWRREATAMFKLSTFSELECTQCGHETIGLNEPENLLPLAIEGRANVTDGLYAAPRRYFTGEISKTCEHCSPSDRMADNTNHISVRKIDAGPQVLTIQLMLFWTNFDKDTKEYTDGKKMNKVAYPMELDLSPYQPEVVAQANDDATFTHKMDPTTNERIFLPNTLLKSKIQAVIGHWGSTIDGGHYIATVRNPNKGLSAGGRRIRKVAYMTSDDAPPVMVSAEALTRTPQIWGKLRCQPYSLTYVLDSGN
jgi:ubiquitin C-terminal hydrolase